MPEVSERKCTNISSLFFCMGFVVLLFILIAYCGFYGDIDRLTKGYDDCGNICGILNKENAFDQCGDHDKRKFPKLLVLSGRNHALHYQCVEKCAEKETFNRCFGDQRSLYDESIFEKISTDLIVHTPNIAAICLIAFVFSYVVLILFRYAIKYIIYIIYISFILLMIMGSIAFFIEKIIELGILFAVLAIISITLLIYFRKRIDLVAKLFKEASKALIDIPSILFEPVLTFLSLMIAFILFIYFTIVIETSGKLEEGEALDGKFQAEFKQDITMQLAIVVNFIAFLWFTQFIFGCQHFVISGTISKWYFTHDKTKLYSPISNTFSNLVSYHLGSICLGSMVITLVKILKLIAKAVQKEIERSNSIVAQCLACCCVWIIEQIERFLKYLVRNAYIIVAKEGTPFIHSAKRAYDLIFENLVDVVALNHFGDLVLIVARLFIVVIAGLFGYALMSRDKEHDFTISLLISLIFAFLIVHCFVTVFEMTVDTIFICFCIDCEENDGINNPYYMSNSLRKVLGEMKEFSGGQLILGPESAKIIEHEQPNHSSTYDENKFTMENENIGNYPITSQSGYQSFPTPSSYNENIEPYNPYYQQKNTNDQFYPSYPAINDQYNANAASVPQFNPYESGYLLNQQPQYYSTCTKN